MKKNNGITLIVLIITIIVMLILVGVMLNMISGENGILGKAEKAVNITNDVAVKEDIELAIFGLMAEYYADHMGEYGDAMEYVKEQCKSGIKTSSGATLKYNEDAGEFEYTKGEKKADVKIDADGKVQVGDSIDTLEPDDSKEPTPVAKYTVTYDANGGDASSVPKDENQYEKGVTVTVDFSTIPKKTGYTFLGWALTNSANASDVIINYTIEEENVTLYAVWQANTYTISYNLNSGTAGASSPTNGTYDILLTINNPTKRGYTFTGWSITGMDSCIHTYGLSTTTEISLSSIKDTSFKNLRSTNGTVTFTANWQQDYPTLASKISTANYGDTVSYSANGVTSWRIFYKDENSNNVYLITTDIAPNSGYIGPVETETLRVNGTDNDSFMEWLQTPSNWSSYANGSSNGVNIQTEKNSITAVGGPTVEQFWKSYNARNSDNKSGKSGFNSADRLYLPSSCYVREGYPSGYWLLSLTTDGNFILDAQRWTQQGDSSIYAHVTSCGATNPYLGVRPLVCLPSSIKTSSTSEPWILTN